MPPKKGPPTPNKPPKNPNWTLDEGEEMRRDINDLQKKTVTKDELQEMRDSMEAKLDTKMVSMDFITGLPKSEGKSVIMVIVDRLTKYAHFCALSHPFKAITVATAFMEAVQKLHGNPKIIVSDRDPIFTGHFWT
jgi:hypothetical protein